MSIFAYNKLKKGVQMKNSSLKGGGGCGCGTGGCK